MVQWDRMDRWDQGYTRESYRQSHLSYMVQWDRMDRQDQGYTWESYGESYGQSHLSFLSYMVYSGIGWTGPTYARYIWDSQVGHRIL